MNEDIRYWKRELDSRSGLSSIGGLENSAECESAINVISLSLADSDYLRRMVSGRGPVYRTVVENARKHIQSSSHQGVIEPYVIDCISILKHILSDKGDILTGAATTHVSSIHA